MQSTPSPSIPLAAAARYGLLTMLVCALIAGTLPMASAWASPADQGPDSAGLATPADELAHHGRARVLVGLPADFAPEGVIGPQRAARQRDHIAADRQRLLADLEGTSFDVAQTFDSVPFVALEVAADALERLRGAGHAVHVDELAWPDLAQSTPLHGAEVLHLAGVTGTGSAVAVLDTGVDASHPAFGGRVVGEACYSSTSGSGHITSLCPDGSDEQVGAGAGAHCDVSLMSACSHGTHVAGIAAAANSTYRGMAPGAGIMAVQVFSRMNDDDSCPGAAPCVAAFTSDIIAGLEHVYEQRTAHPIAAANLSLGGRTTSWACDTSPIKAAIDNLRAAGIATTVSSGNQGLSDEVSWPACVSTAVTVSSTTKADAVSSFANSHPSLVDLYAVGSSVTAPVPAGGFGSSSGTSMAAPQVAGAWALLHQLTPDVAVDTLLAALQTAGTPVTDSRSADTDLHHTHARLDLAAVDLLGDDEPVEEPTEEPTEEPIDDPLEARACPDGDVSAAGFTDVSPSSTHAPAIDCVVWWGIANGTGNGTYSPSNAVTRGQLASFLAATLEASGADLGTPTNQGFTDVAGSVHADRINQLVGAGILNGRSATTFAPDDAVTRAQTATFLVAGYEDTAAATLPAPASGFTDVAGHAHRGNINKAAAAEFVRGTSATTYHPDRVVTRDQLASFLVNLLERSVAEGMASPPR